MSVATASQPRPSRLAAVDRIISEPAERRWLLGATVCALAVRLAWVLAVSRPRGFPFNDTLFYDSVATNLAGGHGYTLSGAPTAHWPPIYTLLLGGVYSVFGHHPVAGEIINAILGALLVPLAYLAASRWLGRTEAKFVAGAVAVMPGLIFFSDVLLTETLYSLQLLILVLLLATSEPTRRRCILIGALIGIAALTRGEGLALLAVVAIVWWGRLHLRELGRRLAIVAAMVALVMSPWVIRNAVKMHAFIPTGTNTGTTIWSGHNPRADGFATLLPPDVLSRYDHLPPVERDVKSSSYLRHVAISYAEHHPLRELVLIPDKVIAFAQGDSRIVPAWINAARVPSAVSASNTLRLGVLADFAWFAILGAALLSLFVFRRQLWGNPLLRVCMACLVVDLVLYGFVFYGNYRYHVTLEPLLIFVAAPLVARIWQWRREALLRSPA
jgi:4-amino-4-deoxy-L-arabinose transferase-like glycosyltransferase